MSSHPPLLLRLPTELHIRILSFVALLGTPRDLSSCCGVCKDFWELLQDQGKAIDCAVWKLAGVSLLGDLCPTEITTDSWQKFVKNAWMVSRPGFRPLAEFETVYTSESGPFPPPSSGEVSRKRKSEFPPELFHRRWSRQHKLPIADGPRRPRLAPPKFPPVPEGAIRVLDIVHTATEASRVVGGASILSATRDHIVFSDDPRSGSSDFTPAELFRAQLTLDGVKLLPESTKSRELVAEEATESGLITWLKSLVHSDSDLVLTPEIVEGNKGPPEVVKVQRISGDSVDRTWSLENSGGWQGLSLNPKKPKGWNEYSPILGDVKQTWEFRSAGSYLVVCNDCNGLCESTISVFSATSTSGAPLWQQRMIGHHPEGGRGFFYDNDGIAISPAYVCYATRSKKPSPMQVCMEFHLFSTATGDRMRILSLPQEGRISASSLCYWTSFSVSETTVVATVGGQNGPRRGFSTPRYGYPEVFVWDLTSQSPHPSASCFTSSSRATPVSPSAAIRLPERWHKSSSVYTQLSPDGRWLVASMGWELAVYDLVEKYLVDIWRVANWRSFDQNVGRSPPVFQSFGWNGSWIVYRDIFPEKHGRGEQTGVIFVDASMWRKIGKGEVTLQRAGEIQEQYVRDWAREIEDARVRSRLRLNGFMNQSVSMDDDFQVVNLDYMHGDVQDGAMTDDGDSDLEEMGDGDDGPQDVPLATLWAMLQEADNEDDDDEEAELEDEGEDQDQTMDPEDGLLWADAEEEHEGEQGPVGAFIEVAPFPYAPVLPNEVGPADDSGGHDGAPAANS